MSEQVLQIIWGPNAFKFHAFSIGFLPHIKHIFLPVIVV